MAIHHHASSIASVAVLFLFLGLSITFVRAETLVNNSLPTASPFLHAISMSKAIVTFQTATLPFHTWFKPLFTILATLWLFSRVYLVLTKPVEQLASQLGVDIPSSPSIDLASIKADGAIIHWSLLDKQRHKNTLKFEIHVNGNLVETLSIHESAATISNLQPSSFYVVRVSLVNSIEFASKSEPLRFRTKHASSDDFFHAPADIQDVDRDVTQDAIPRVRPYRGLKDTNPILPDSTALNRENSNVAGPRRSFGTVRRPSPAGPDPALEDGEPAEGAETVQQLTEKLDALRRENEEAEKAAKDDEEEELRQKDDLIRERDELKAEVAEKERANRNLKREVTTLERQNTAAQNERTKHERILLMKKQERQKLKDDIVRWEREAAEMHADVQRIREYKVELLHRLDEEKEMLQARQLEEAAAIKILDEDMREKNAEIKKVERSMKNTSPSGSDPEPNLVQRLQQEAEEKRVWDMDYANLTAKYGMSVQQLERANKLHADAKAQLDYIRMRRLQDEATYYASPPQTQERLPRRTDSQRNRHTQSENSNSESPRLAAFGMSSSAFAPAMTSTSSMFSNAVLFPNGMTVTIPPDEHTLSDEDKDRLTGGALMSPGAGAELIPQDLFADDHHKQTPDFVQPLPGLGSLPGLPVPPHTLDYSAPGPASPASAGSRSPSVFASPLASQQNLQLGSPEHMIDADRRSIRSTRSNRATSGGGYGSRFSGMFGIKQRSKTNPLEEGPKLGSAQSQSMPRQDQGIPGIDANSRKRNSSISGSTHSFNFAPDPSHDLPVEAATTSRRKTFGLFSKDRTDAWPTTFTGFGRRPASPRPGSTHSTELPRPSSDTSRWGADAWPTNESFGGARGSPLAFGGGWNIPGVQQSRLFGSRHPSRRPSVQYGVSAPPENIIEDEDSDAIAGRGDAYLAPIGTKRPIENPETNKQLDGELPRLNPNAKDFRSFLSSMKLRDKAKDSGSTPSSSTIPNIDWPDHNEDSPPASRKSKDTRDTRSMTTTESSIAESGRSSSELGRTISHSNNSDAPAPSPLLTGSAAGKEKFMKLVRKSSSGAKFTMPTFKREKSRLDPGSATSISSPHIEDDEESMSASQSSLKEREGRESKETNRLSGRGWSNVLKIGRKKGNETPSLSGQSLTSGTEEGEDGEESFVH